MSTVQDGAASVKVPVRYLGEVASAAELVDALRRAHFARLAAAEFELDPDDRFRTTEAGHGEPER